MATSLQNVRKELLLRLGEELGEYGFARKGEDFARKTVYGKDLIQAFFVPHPGKYLGVDLSIGVRHDAVEDLVNAFTPGIPRKLKPWTETVGNRLDNMLGQFMMWTIENEEQLKWGIRRMLRTVRAVALPFFDRFSSLAECLKVLALDGEEGSQFKSGEPGRAMAAVAAAFVLGNRGTFDEVVEYKARFLREFCAGKELWEARLPEFLALVEDLQRRWPADL